jgi:transposase
MEPKRSINRDEFQRNFIEMQGELDQEISWHPLGELEMKLHANARTCPHCRSLIVSRVIEDKQSTSKVAGEFRVTSRTVHKWIRRYRTERAAGLEDRSSAPHSSPRRQLQAGKELHGAVMSLLHTPPGDSGYNRTTWRMSDLKAELLARGTQATRNNIRLVIKRAGFQWKQARVVLTSLDPRYREKVAAIKAILSQIAEDEAVFSIDELGPVAVKTRAGKSLQGPGQHRVVPQWQKSRGSFILTAALELSKNQITHFFSERKNTTETIALIELLRKRYAKLRKLYLCWDAAPWHSSAPLKTRIAFLNDWAAHDEAPEIELLPLPPARSS